ncbi:DNA topoisomerase 3 [Halotalea alkalilenta]|uniref:DNA topoisomerase n=1 Tax=Halotalea alkalilenta TaxID=376489 RepID=A0A172YFE3_9GAMM|nr:DNA topoisomerase 3 [Halotalea alkalilenta]ANF57990.1 DNA topoisomerase III [Halotalea alkalilenta]
MRLIIAEKPSLARAIAAACPQYRFDNREGHLAAQGLVISWCFGHLLEQAPPDAYDPRYKHWALDHLPIIPATWQLMPRPKSRAQLAVLKRLIKSASEVVHAGDPDREGQLLVQETLDYLGWRGPVKRLLINDMNESAVRKALGAMRDNAEFDALFEAAQSRSRADWLYGINLSRAWTLIGKRAGHDGVLSVGRVQTPVLGLIARRDAAIEAFVPVPFHVLWADFRTQGGVTRAWWQPLERERLQAEKRIDEEGRLLAREIAEDFAATLPGAAARLAQLERKPKRQRAPMPYSLSTLQVDAARRHKLSAQQVLDAAQALYERHQLITYPRSDCRHLPVNFLDTAAATLDAACRGDATLAQWLGGADMRLRGKAFDDGKITAHHALAPTGRAPQWSRLSPAQTSVYRLVVRNVLAQFYPDHEYLEVKALFEAPLDHARPAEPFLAQGREIKVEGWKPLFTVQAESPPLPPLRQGEAAQVTDHGIDDRMTQPPAPFNDASLLNAMTHVARYVEDPEVRRTLRETDGLGTEATRAGIIETLIKRALVVRAQGALRATRAGRALVDALPESATRPERTALWEQELSLICEGRRRSAPFMEMLITELRELLGEADVARMRAALAQSATLALPEAKQRRGGKGSAKSTGKHKRTAPRRRRASAAKPG